MTPDPQFRRDTPLARALKTRIRREGPLDVRAYMDACLYHPQHGVYRAKPAIGRAGDFVTAPEISQIFGELIGLWCAVVWQQMGSPTAVDLIEIGPGRGTLMRDALRVTRGVPGFHAALRVILVDSSEALTAVQRTTLADVIVPIEWHASLEGLGRDAATPALLVANEQLDCQPRDQFLRLGDGWVLRRIGLDTAGELALDDTAPPVSMPELDALHGSAQDGDIAEWGAYDSLRQALTLRSTFGALMIDYGHTQPGLGDTLQAVRRHRYEHPLTSPGEADVTMQVDFADEGLYYEAAAGPNWWEYYFEPVMIGGATEATRRTVPLWQHDTWAENVERQMTRNAAASIVRRHIRLKPAVNDQVNEFWRAHAGDGSVIGVHYRGTDKSEEARRVSYDALAAAVRHTLRGGLAAAKVFLATDEQACVDHMSQAFPDRLITRPVRRSLDGRPVHKRPGDGFRKGEEAVTDCLLLSRGAALVRTASNLGLAAGFFNPAIPVMLVEAGA